jgi:nucleoid-associated protein YgaU
MKMNKNGAIWVALGVVAVAALVMYFFVLPQMRDDKTAQELAKKASETVEQAKDTAEKTVDKAKDAAQTAAEQTKQAVQASDVTKQATQIADQAKDTVKEVAADPKAGILQKMARLKADGEQATVEFEQLFADNKRPTVEQIEAARAKLEAALKNASEMKAPEGLDPATLALIANMSQGAQRALVALKATPDDVASAKAAYDALKLTMMAALEGKEAPKIATEPAQEIAKLDDAKPADNMTAEKPADAAKAEIKPAETPAEAIDANLPSFDVLRVEKDGSTVIAGKTGPGAKIDVLDGDKVIASTVAGPEGDFVIVLDNPLVAGDHSIVLQATGKDGKKVVSVEVATVSVPADKSGKLLAMVTKPGEASRIMETPEADNQTVVARNDDQAVKAELATKDVTVEVKQETVDAKKEPIVEAKTEQKPDAQKAEVKPVEVAKQEPVEVAEQKADKPEEAKSEDKTVATPALPDAATELANTAPVVKQDVAKVEDTVKAEVKPTDTTKPADTTEIAKNDAATPAEPAKTDTQTASSDTAEVAKAETDSAAKTETSDVKPANVEPKPAEKAQTLPEVLVNAVEIEGNKIFVAGTARPKSVVRVYADDKLVAEVRTDENGRFVADNSLPLSVGNHTIRADVLSNDGKKVEVRASVPFFRPEGEQLAAVNSDAEAASDQKMKPLADGDYDRAREEAGKAVALLKALYNAGRTPTLDELAAARSATEIALKTLSQIRLSDNDNPVAKQIADKTAGEAAKALALLKSLPQDANAVKTALNSIDDAVTSAVSPAMQMAAANKTTTATEKAKSTDDTAVKQPVKPDTAEVADNSAKQSSVQNSIATDVAKADNVVKNDTAADTVKVEPNTEVAATDDSQPKVIEQAPLTASQSASVIIRRGDTLWQISRRVYGMGVRYTTIYMANEDQISNPDRIMPGQIFGMPEKYLPNAEELHRERMKHKKQ